ncbi:MAG: hypothetical protein KDD31_04010 [Muricauda sp.]|nr:hypothetical protein [Allomuricauda sp.]
MTTKLEGIGSFFNEIAPTELKDLDNISFLGEHKLFYTGRHAARYIIDYILKKKSVRYIWIPAYYCHHVIRWLQDVYPNTRLYEVSPFTENSHADLKEVGPDDIVIFNNFFGITNMDYPRVHEETIYIEDHSHGWLSEQCMNSKADYCFVSLRKSLPTPLGGVFWVPKSSKMAFFEQPDHIEQSIPEKWDQAGEAMHLKKRFMDSEIEDKSYLDVYREAEDFLDHQYEFVQMTPDHKQLLKAFYTKDYAYYKKRNLGTILPKLKDSDFFKVLNFDGKFTFGLPLIFKNREDFSALRSYLITHQIYPSELWPENTLEKGYKYLLNVHIDFRYGPKEMEYIAQIINEWTNQYNPQKSMALGSHQ